MKLVAKLALGSCAVAVGVCGVLAFIAADDERRDFVKGSTRATSVLPADVLVVDVEVDDEYEDTDDEADRADVDARRLVPVQPVAEQAVAARQEAKEVARREATLAAMSTDNPKTTAKTTTVNIHTRPETVDDDELADPPERVPRGCKTKYATGTGNNNTVEVGA